MCWLTGIRTCPMNQNQTDAHTHTHHIRLSPAVPVFRDLTRNRESFRERTMEHDTFVTNLPRVRFLDFFFNRACVRELGV
jgi:hypothetical protein